MKKLPFYFFLLLSSLVFPNESVDSDTTTYDEEQLLTIYANYLDSIETSLNFQEKGTVNIGDELATVDIPTGFRYLNSEQSEYLLVDIWDNPPGDKSLGMIVPADLSIMDPNNYVINITYAEEGFVEDEDAKDIDYEELLETMKEDFVASNESRVAQGYEEIALVGWAANPYYDEENKKLHWAKELKFGESEEHVLNYSIRILGRKGYLQLNAIGGMNVLDKVNSNISPILASVNFDSGNTYADFDPDIDEIAAYGIGGLIAGKILLKAGLLAKLGLILAKFWKVIAIGFVALFGGIKKIFGGKSNNSEKPTIDNN